MIQGFPHNCDALSYKVKMGFEENANHCTSGNHDADVTNRVPKPIQKRPDTLRRRGANKIACPAASDGGRAVCVEHRLSVEGVCGCRALLLSNARPRTLGVVEERLLVVEPTKVEHVGCDVHVVAPAG